MTAHRTARPALARPLAIVCLAALAAAGCGTGEPPDAAQPSPAVQDHGSSDPSWLTSRQELPPPNPDRLDYDPQERTLTLYDLPGPDRWMVQLPDEARGRAVGLHHRLPDGVDTRSTLVYYVRVGEKVSAPVSVADIEACRPGPTSFAQP